MTGHEPFPLTPLQEAYLVGASRLVELGGFRPTYYVEFDLVNADLTRAAQALHRVVRRHAHLRTVIEDTGTQRVLDDERTWPVRPAVADLTGLSEDRRQAAVRHTRERMCRDGVDPVGRPLFEIVVNRLRPRRVRVHLAMSLLLLDGRSIRQVMDEWRAYYHDPAAELPPPALTYRDCRLELLADENTEAYRDQWRYWEERLDHLPDAPRLPLAVQPAAIETVRLTRRTHRLTRAQWQRLSAAVRRHRVLPTTALCHLFAETLGAWAAVPHFSLNLLHQNWAATRPHMAGVVGQFGATLPLEVDLRQPGDFWERARRLQRQVWKDLQHADVAGVRITRELAARRGWTSRAALPYVFTSMLKSGGTTGHAPPAGGRDRLACREVTSDLRTPQVLVDNQLHDGPDGGVDCVWDVVDDAFPPGLPDLMFEAYGRMLDTLTAPSPEPAPPHPVSPRHRALIAELNRPVPVPAPAAGRLEDGFLRRAADQPAAPAVLTDHRTLTYAELESRSRAVACALGGRGVGRGDIVPVVMTKGWEQIVAVLGVLRSGAAYCPVDAALPDERISRLLDGVSARIALVRSTDASRIAAPDRPVIAVDRLRPAAGQVCARTGEPDDLAYLIHTSGSTGQPKGVMIEHRAAVNTVEDINQRLELGPGDRVFGISSLSFDLSVWDVFGALAAGAALVLPGATRRPDPLGWADTAARHGVTVWNSVPALAQMLAEVADQRPGTGTPPVRAFLLSGDWIPVELPGRLRSHWHDARVVAMGGATEASIWSNIHETGRGDPGRSIPYGVPLRNQTMRVLDHRLEVRPPWAVGRIHIGGSGLARGYWQDPARTGERFIRHPGTGERLYVTGDLGRYRPDGTIEFLGREDRQLKIQGFRVEPGEVEAVIRDHPAVSDCVVTGEDVPGGQRRLVSLVVPHEDGHLDDGMVLDHLRSRLPHYLIPGRIHVLPRLPLTPNGKVDLAAALAALRAPTPPGPAAAPGSQERGEGTRPDAELVQRLSALWTELLELPAVDPDSDDFFALGGNSLLALRLINRIHADLGVELEFGRVFEAPTVRALAGHVARHDTGAGRTADCRVTLSGGAGPGRAAASAAERRPLVLFHPVGGSVSSYTALARSWPGPVHAFQSRALARGSTDALDPDLVTMATSYREELQRTTPEGPYLLGGWSMGGVLAHEAGRQLAERGHDVRVFLIDSDLTEDRAAPTEAAAHLEFLGDLAGGRLPEQARAAVLGAPPGLLTRTALETSVTHGWLPAGTGARQYELLLRVHAHNLNALGGYRADKSEVPTLLLVAGAADRADPVPAWREVCAHLDVETWPEDHYSIVAGDRPAAIAGRVASWLGDPRAQR